MKINITEATLDLRPGVRMTINAEGVIVIDAAPAAPLKAADHRPAFVPIAKKQRVASPDPDEPPAVPEVLRHQSQTMERVENQILQALLDQRDPYQWRNFAAIFKLTFPRTQPRKNGEVSVAYRRFNDALKRLRDAHEVDYQRSGTGRGRGAQAVYRLHKADEAARSNDPAPISDQSALNGIVSLDH